MDITRFTDREMLLIVMVMGASSGVILGLTLLFIGLNRELTLIFCVSAWALIGITTYLTLMKRDELLAERRREDETE